MPFWRLHCGLILIITCFDISFCLKYSDKLTAILLRNKHLAPYDKAGFDSTNLQAEEWSDDDPSEEYIWLSLTAVTLPKIQQNRRNLIHIPYQNRIYLKAMNQNLCKIMTVE
jgi:hypothetical protein